jgi:hypothetical protein
MFIETVCIDSTTSKILLRPWKALPSCVLDNAKVLYHNITRRWQRALCTSVPDCHNRIETTSLELLQGIVTRLPIRWVSSPTALRSRVHSRAVTFVHDFDMRKAATRICDSRFASLSTYQSVTDAAPRPPLSSRLLPLASGYFIEYYIRPLSYWVFPLSSLISTFNTSANQQET